MLSAIAALVLITILPGPDFAVVSRFALSNNRRAAFGAAFGILSGLAIWGVLVVAGLAAVLSASSNAYTLIRIAGAVFLLFMGLRVLWRHRRVSARGDEARPTEALSANRAWQQGLIGNLFNPKIGVFYTSLLPSLVPHGESPRLWLPVLAATHVVISLAWFSLCAYLLSSSRRWLMRPRVNSWLNRVTGIALVSFGLRVAAEVRV